MSTNVSESAWVLEWMSINVSESAWELMWVRVHEY